MQNKILISIPWFSPAFKAGGPIQSVANLVNSCNNEITYRIVTSNADVDQQLLKEVKYNEWVDFSPNSKVYYQSNYGLLQTINFWKNIKNTDTLFIIGIYSLKFNLFPLFFSSSKNKILSIRGMLHPGALSQKKLKKKFYLFLLKTIQIQNKITFHATNETEEQFIKNIFGNQCKIKIAGNYPKLYSYNNINNKQSGKIKIVTVALISPMKNHLLVLQSLKQCEGVIEYHIVGAIKDHHYWNQCLKEINEMPGNIKIIYHGEVPPDETFKYLSNAHVFIMPSKSENYAHAIIEALSAGKPVITSKNTPWNELEKHKAGNNVNLEIAEIKNALQFFIDLSQSEYEKYSMESKLYSEKVIDFKKLQLQYQNLFSNTNE